MAVIGGVAVVAAFARRPADVAVLAEIDRRLGLHELLSSAASLAGDDPATRLVRDQAGRAAAAIDARAVFRDPRPARSLTTACVALAAGVALSLTLGPAATTVGVEPRDGSARPTPATPAVAGRAGRPEAESTRSFDAPAGAAADAARAASAGGSARGARDAAGSAAGTSAMPTPSTPRGTDRPASPSGNAAAVGDGQGDDADDVGRVAAGEAIAARGRLRVPAAEGVDKSSRVGPRPGVDVASVPPASRDLVRAFFTPDDDEGRP